MDNLSNATGREIIMPEQAPTLRDMIQKAIKNGRTLRDIEDHAVDEHGNSVGKDTVRKIARGLINRMPLKSHLRALAVSLRVPYEEVRQAAIREWLPAENGTAKPIDDEEDRARLIEEIKRLQGVADEVLARVEGSADSGERRGGAA